MLEKEADITKNADVGITGLYQSIGRDVSK